MANKVMEYIVAGKGKASTVKELAELLGTKVTQKAVLAGEVEGVHANMGDGEFVPELPVPVADILVYMGLKEADVPSDTDIDQEHKAEFARQEEEQERKAMIEAAKEEATRSTLAKLQSYMEDVTDDARKQDLEDLYADVEDGNMLTDAQQELLMEVLTGDVPPADVEEDDTPADEPVDHDEDDVPSDEPQDTNTPSDVVYGPVTSKQKLADKDVEYPELGSFKDDKELKKFIKQLSDKQVHEWVQLEGLTFKPNEHAAINRMRMAMAIKDAHFPKATSGSGTGKSKSKYAKFSTEELVSLALENDVEVKDDKGDPRILRMYTIMALRNAGVLD